MKKFLLLATTLLLLAFNTVCLAADGGTLNKEQSAAGKFLTQLTAAQPVYITAVSGFDPSLKEKITADGYSKLLQDIKEKLGDLIETRFRTFQRNDDLDVLIYQASFSKENVVIVRFDFNTSGKIVALNLQAIKQPEQEQN